MTELGIKEPKTLKELLEFLSKLEESSVKTKVIIEIKEKVQEYFKDDEQKFGNPTTGYLFETIDKSKKLRRNIVKSENDYKHYRSPFQDGDADYAKHLIDNIFALFGCLYYMYYECSYDCYGIKGGQWWDEKCDGTGGKDNLKKWLTTDSGTGRMIQRGFQEGELTTKTGGQLFPFTEYGQTESKSLLYYLQGAQLQFALYFMLLLPTPDKWNRGQSGHAVLFLKAFCEEITGGEFDDDHTAADGGSFNNACGKVQGSIISLMGSNTIVPVASSDTVKYKDLMADEHFGSYFKWLQGILPKLIESLKEMASDVSKWDEEAFKKSTTFGPYPWGFTFQSHWESNKAQLNGPLQKLTQALSGLKNALPSTWKGKRRSKRAADESSNSTASTASTVGGVAAGLGAAAGAAYAGSGFLGPVAESIGRFFRGLFL